MSWKSVVVLVATLAFDASLMAQNKAGNASLTVIKFLPKKTGILALLVRLTS
jgi:hypothetical protein